MFFKKKVGKGARGEGKNLRSIFIIIIIFFFSFPFPPSQGEAGHSGQQLLGFSTQGRAVSRVTSSLHAWRGFASCSQAACAASPATSVVSLRMVALGHLGPAGTVLCCVPWGCSASPIAVVPRAVWLFPMDCSQLAALGDAFPSGPPHTPPPPALLPGLLPVSFLHLLVVLCALGSALGCCCMVAALLHGHILIMIPFSLKDAQPLLPSALKKSLLLVVFLNIADVP